MFGAAPRFWWLGAPNWQARLLGPAATLYGAVTARRMARPGRRMPVPVLCIGNFVAGGAGKTPTVLAVAHRLLASGEKPAFLSRGYGRRTTRVPVIEVDPARHGAGEVGDEPLLLARLAPTFVAADRVRAAEAAVAQGASILLMDDGLQSPALAKDAAIAVVDGASGIGNGLCMPAGPLRAPMSGQWARVSLLCIIGAGEAGETVGRQARDHGTPVVRARLEPDAATRTALGGRRLLAFSGIGRPGKFFRTLEDSGLQVVGCRAFADHHVFGDGDLEALLRDAKRSGAELITTEKDATRLPPGFATAILPVRLAFEEGVDGLDALLDRILDRRLSPA